MTAKKQEGVESPRPEVIEGRASEAKDLAYRRNSIQNELGGFIEDYSTLERRLNEAKQRFEDARGTQARVEKMAIIRRGDQFSKELVEIKKQVQENEASLRESQQRFDHLEARMLVMAAEHATLDGRTEEGTAQLQTAIEFHQAKMDEIQKEFQGKFDAINGSLAEARRDFDQVVGQIGEAYRRIIGNGFYYTFEDGPSSVIPDNISTQFQYLFNRLSDKLNDAKKAANYRKTPRFMNLFGENVMLTFEDVGDGKLFALGQERVQAKEEELKEQKAKQPLLPFGSKRAQWEHSVTDLQKELTKFQKEVDHLEKNRDSEKSENESVRATFDEAQKNLEEVKILQEQMKKIAEAMQKRNSAKNNNRYYQETYLRQTAESREFVDEATRALEMLKFKPDHPIYKKVEELTREAEEAQSTQEVAPVRGR